jgi:hypothetical protein
MMVQALPLFGRTVISKFSGEVCLAPVTDGTVVEVDVTGRDAFTRMDGAATRE